MPKFTVAIKSKFVQLIAILSQGLKLDGPESAGTTEKNESNEGKMNGLAAPEKNVSDMEKDAKASKNNSEEKQVIGAESSYSKKNGFAGRKMGAGMGDTGLSIVTVVPKGIENIQYQCYAIACMQSLMSCKSFVGHINRLPQWTNDVVDELKAFGFAYSWSRDLISITKLMKSVDLSPFVRDDPCELLKRLSEYIGVLYRCNVFTATFCSECEKPVEQNCEFDCVIIHPKYDTQGRISLLDCVQEQFACPTRLKSLCKKCGDGEQCEFNTLQQPLPKILIFNLMLYIDSYSKVELDVKIPEMIDMKPFVQGKVKGNLNYVLRSVVNYDPGQIEVNTSHYTTISRRNKKNFFCNDASVKLHDSTTLGGFTVPYLAFFELEG